MPVLWRRVLIFFLALLPLVFIVYKTLVNQLGADPAKTIVLFTGEWTIYFLFITLAVTPLRRLINFRKVHLRWLQVHRRMLGLFSLFYALLHVLAFLVFILGLDFTRFGKELVERPYILVTIPAVILLIALGVTSTQAMMRRLGKKWGKLHKSIYLIAILGWVHVFMQVRSSYFEAVLFGVILVLLFVPRLYWVSRK
ncbi:sulfoxide reductase heme-binding subunit YedZ [Cellvibrio sp. KY-GH-1]|uniref:sulfite oxidase heme-binding subunit YedZ n=1 Tax=Cellvibrio sp. KY-GH-1 TaxID=2303332 RepID=UPI0012475090|nr:protein-methionine-sulfoxide reductase heme-binding subunit MsrQ [Cellvibrio sp. KY-GH-1]QEY15661.1 sulfoxide reductase heme-binding subunit YedZ [Cellvibrio sp. KY-GH-1]